MERETYAKNIRHTEYKDCNGRRPLCILSLAPSQFFGLELNTMSVRNNNSISDPRTIGAVTPGQASEGQGVVRFGKNLRSSRIVGGNSTINGLFIAPVSPEPMPYNYPQNQIGSVTRRRVARKRK
jgi:hypothetical protein